MDGVLVSNFIEFKFDFLRSDYLIRKRGSQDDSNLGDVCFWHGSKDMNEEE